MTSMNTPHTCQVFNANNYNDNIALINAMEMILTLYAYEIIAINVIWAISIIILLPAL